MRFYDRGVLMKTHPRKPPGGKSTDPHCFPEHEGAVAQRDTAFWMGLAKKKGRHVERSAETLLAGPMPSARMRQVYALLGLANKHGAKPLDEACRVSLELEMHDIRRLGRVPRLPRAAVAAFGRPAGTHPISAPRLGLRLRRHCAPSTTPKGEGMTATETISADLGSLLRRLKLGKVQHTLPQRLALARQNQMPHQDFLVLLLGDEVARRDSNATAMRAQRARLEPAMQIEHWDPSAKVTLDQHLLNELVSLRFIDAHAHVAIVGPVGVGKTFLVHALGHIGCRLGHSVLAVRTAKMFKNLKHARLDHSYDAEIRTLLSVDVLILDDFGLDAMDSTESCAASMRFDHRHLEPDEWLATSADPMRGQAAIDRFTSNTYELVIEGESYRRRLKPKL